MIEVNVLDEVVNVAHSCATHYSQTTVTAEQVREALAPLFGETKPDDVIYQKALLSFAEVKDDEEDIFDDEDDDRMADDEDDRMADDDDCMADEDDEEDENFSDEDKYDHILKISE